MCGPTGENIKNSETYICMGYYQTQEGGLTKPRKPLRNCKIQQHWISAWSVCPPPRLFFPLSKEHGLNFSGLTSHWAGASCPFLSACHVTQCNVAFLCNRLRHVMPMTCQACEFQKDTVQ